MRIFLLALLAGATAYAQTYVPVVTPAQQSPMLSISMPAGTVYRIGDAKNNKYCVYTATVTPVVAYADGQTGHPSDCDPGTAKGIDVLQTSTTQVIKLTNSSVNPAVVTSVTIKANKPPTVTATYPASCVVYSDSSFVCTVTQ